jgi:hypothetical protein
MNPSPDPRIQSQLKSAFPPVRDGELQRDLWPDMLKRIESDVDGKIAFGLMDWILAGLVAASVLVFPGLIPELLYHL